MGRECGSGNIFNHSLIQMIAVFLAFHPHVDFDDVFRRRAAGFENAADVGEHVGALAGDALDQFAGGRIFSVNSPGHQQPPDAAGVGDGVDMFEAGDFNAASFAHADITP